MKKTNGTMKFLIILPILLFVLLAGWIGGTEWKVRQGSREAVSKADRNTLAVSDQQTAKAPVEESSSQEVLTVEEETKESGTNQEQNPVVHLLFCGRYITFYSCYGTAYDKSGGINGILDEGMRSEIGKADIFMANQEFPFSRPRVSSAGQAIHIPVKS